MYLKRRIEHRVRRMRFRAKGEAAAPHVKALVAGLEAARLSSLTPGKVSHRSPVEDHDARRANRRLPVATEVSVRKAGGFSFQLRAFDVSAGGCRVELVEAVDPDERVIVRLPTLEPLAAEVEWVYGNVAGLRFERPLHPAVFDNLMDRLSA